MNRSIFAQSIFELASFLYNFLGLLPPVKTKLNLLFSLFFLLISLLKILMNSLINEFSFFFFNYSHKMFVLMYILTWKICNSNIYIPSVVYEKMELK